MENSKKKLILVNIAKIVILALIILVVDKLIGFYIEPVKYSDYFRHDPVYKKAEAEGSDLIFMGGSHMEMCMNPKVFEDKLGYKNVLNVSATDQPIKGLYFYMQELVKECKPSCIVVDITNQNLFRPTYYQGQMNLMDKMSLPYKLKYYFSDEDLIKATPYLLRTYKYQDFFFKDTRVRKVDVARSGYQEGDGYEYGGFERTLPLYEEGGVPFENYLGDDSNTEINEEALTYLLKMKSFCDKNNISFYTVSCPISLMAIYSTYDYEDRLNKYIKWADENDIKYHNLSYLKDREQVVGDTMWDPGHVAGDAGDRVSNVYADILQEDMKGNDTKEYFYDNLSQMRQDVRRIVAVNANFDQDESIISVNVESIHGDDLEPLYRVTLLELGKETVVYDWGKEQNIQFECGYIAPDTCVVVEAMANGLTDQVTAKQTYFLAQMLN